MNQLNSENIISEFQEFLRDQTFPCVGAKSALSHDQISFYKADGIRTRNSDKKITEKLQDFASGCTSESLFVSFVVIFENTPPLDEIEFERHLWERLQAIHNKDSENFR